MEKILIYDDILIHAEDLKKLILNLEPDADVHISTDRLLSENLIEKNTYDILFIDIELDDGMSGIDFADNLQKNGCNAELVYITAYTKYYEEIFMTRPAAFISKPFSAVKVKRVFEILQKKRNENAYIVLHSTKNTAQKIYLENIIYIAHENRHLNFYDVRRNVVNSFYDKKLSEIEDDLPDYFVRCHHSFAVNLKYAVKIKRFCFSMEGNFDISISQSCFTDTKKKFIAYLENSI